MASRGEHKRRAREGVSVQDASKVELVTATLHLIGGDTRYVVLDELAMACHRLAPSVFSWPQYLWLPSLDSVRVTLVDVKRAGLAEEGAEGRGRTLKGVRLSEAGRQWIARSGALLEGLRRRLPEPSQYLERPAEGLVAVAVLSASELDGAAQLPRERVVAESFRLFPERFSLHGFAGWPDSARVDEAAREATWIAVSPEGWALRPEHRAEVQRLREEIHVKSSGGFGATKRRQTQGAAQKAVQFLERSALWKLYASSGQAAPITDEDICDILAVTLESRPETVRKHYDSMSRLIEQAERWDLLEFMKWIGAWCEAHEFRLVQA